MPEPISNAARRAGRILSGIVVFFLALDAAMKLAVLREVQEAMTQLGWPMEAAVPLGVLLMACTLLYAVPRTAITGAVLLTGYLGGAIATHARLGDPLFSHTLFGVYVGILMWLGLYLRNEKLRALAPWRA
jgi:hypothetical protein